MTDIVQLYTSKDAFAQTVNPVLTLTPSFSPTVLKGMRVDQQNPFNFEFLVDSPVNNPLDQVQAKQLIKYFLAVLTVPEKDLWVNLSPVEKNRIIPKSLGLTAVGRELLLQDELLKRLAASLSYPESSIGKEFWNKVYDKARKIYGTTQVPLNTFQKVWIVPDKAVVYEYGPSAFIAESHLRVMLDEDYKMIKKKQESSQIDEKLGKEQDLALNPLPSQSKQLSLEITREVIVPALEQEVNQGRHFAVLRQIFHALILASWFKTKLRSHLISRTYADQSKVKGIDENAKDVPQKIYEQYLETFKKGVYNYIRVDFDEETSDYVPRRYFSGGFTAGSSAQWLDIRPINSWRGSWQGILQYLGQSLKFIRVQLQPLGANSQINFNPMASVHKLAAIAITAALLGHSAIGHSAVTPQSSAIIAPAQVSQEVLVNQKAVVAINGNLTQPDKKMFDLLKTNVDIDDVLSLNQRLNPITKKPYHIDKQYFQRNWNQVFNSTSYGWAQQTVVIAMQKKLGLREDGVLGPLTRHALGQYANSAQVHGLKHFIEQNQVAHNLQQDLFPNLSTGDFSKQMIGGQDFSISHFGAEDKKVILQSNPPALKEEKTLIHQGPIGGEQITQTAAGGGDDKGEKGIFKYWHLYKSKVFEVLAFIVLLFQSMRIYQDYRKVPSDQVEFLRVLTSYLRGEKKTSIRLPGPLMGSRAVLADMTASIVNGKRIEIVLRAGNTLGTISVPSQEADNQTQVFFEQLFKNRDLIVMQGKNEFSLVSVKRFDNRIHLVLENADRDMGGVTVYYRWADSQLRNFDLQLLHDSLGGLEDYWRSVLKRPDILTPGTIAEVVEELREFRRHHPFVLKDFRNQAAIAKRLESLSREVLKAMDGAGLTSGPTRAYFSALGIQANLVGYMMAQSATLDSYKSSFLPSRDKLNFNFMGLRLDKISRIISLVDYMYNRARKRLETVVPQYVSVTHQMNDIEEQILWHTDQSPKIPTEESLKRDIAQFSLSFEQPYNNSLVGLDLWRRHEKIVKTLSNALLVLFPFFIFWVTNITVSFWWPALIGILNIIIFQFIVPNFWFWQTQRQFEYNKKLISDNISLSPDLNSAPESLTPKGQFLQDLSMELLKSVSIRPKMFVLEASHFYDVTAVRENSCVELRFLTNSTLPTSERKVQEGQAYFERMIKSNELSFWTNHGTQIFSKHLMLFWHETGVRIRLNNFPDSQSQVIVRYSPRGDGIRIHEIPLHVVRDEYKILVNEWDHWFEEIRQGNDARLQHLMKLIANYMKPSKLKLSEFRKNAGYFYEMRDRALRTSELLYQKEFTADTKKQIEFFISVARYANAVRYLMASFSGMDTLKSRFFPDDDKFRKQFFGIQVCLIARAVFGVSFLYEWARTDTRKAIRNVGALGHEVTRAAQRVLHQSVHDTNVDYERPLREEFQRADFAFRYPQKGSLVGRDFHYRNLRMWTMLFYLGWLAVTLGLMAIPYLFTILGPIFTSLGVNAALVSTIGDFISVPRILGLSLVNVSLVLYIVIYWVNPMHAYNNTQREYLYFEKQIIDHSQALGNTVSLKARKQKWLNQTAQGAYVLFYTLGIIEPTIVLMAFIYQQVKFVFLGDKNSNGHGFHSEEKASAGSGEKEEAPINVEPDFGPTASSSVNIKNNTDTTSETNPSLKPEESPGGIDLKTSENLQVITSQSGLNSNNSGFELSPDQVQGMKFKILDFEPVQSPATFLMNFVNDQNVRLSKL